MFKRGLINSVPIAMGYLPVAITFAISAMTKGFNEMETLLASALIFAGASQFALIALMSDSFISAVLIPIVLNLRHIIYGCIISQRFKIKIPFITAFGLTDEVFALSLNANNETFIWGLEVGAYLAWILGTLIGIAGGAILLSNGMLKPSLTFSLTALFLILLITNFKGYNALAAVVGGIIALLFHFMGCTSIGILLAGIVSPIVVSRVKVCWSTTWQ